MSANSTETLSALSEDDGVLVSKEDAQVENSSDNDLNFDEAVNDIYTEFEDGLNDEDVHKETGQIDDETHIDSSEEQHSSPLQPLTLVDRLHNIETTLRECLQTQSPLSLAIHFFLQRPESHFPAPSSVEAGSLRVVRLPVYSNGAYHVATPNNIPATFRIVFRIDPEDSPGNRNGSYMDLYINNGQTTLKDLAKMRFRVAGRTLANSYGQSVEDSDMITDANNRFGNYLALMNNLYTDFAESKPPPADCKVTEWVRQVSGNRYYAVFAMSECLLENVPFSKGSGYDLPKVPAGGKLPELGVIAQENQQNNLDAFLRQKEYEPGKEIGLANLDDPELVFEKLATTVDLTKITFKQPDFRDAHGDRVHPMRFHEVFVSGAIVTAEVQAMMWDLPGVVRNNNRILPSRSCNTIITSMRVLPKTAEDVIDLWKEDELEKEAQLQRELEAFQMAERERFKARELEAERIAKAKLRTQQEEVAKEQRRKRLDALLKTSLSSEPPKSSISLPSTNTVAVPKAVVSIDKPSTSSPSSNQTPSSAKTNTLSYPTKRGATSLTTDSSFISPKKIRTARMTTGGKPPPNKQGNAASGSNATVPSSSTTVTTRSTRSSASKSTPLSDKQKGKLPERDVVPMDED